MCDGCTSYIAGVSQHTAHATNLGSLGPTFAAIPCLRVSICAAWLLALAKSLQSNISLLAEPFTPTVPHQPIVKATGSVGAVPNELNGMVNSSAAFASVYARFPM